MWTDYKDEPMKDIQCTHEYNINNYSRDDLCFHLQCSICGEVITFECNSEDDFFSLFIDDDDWTHVRWNEDKSDIGKSVRATQNSSTRRGGGNGRR